MKQMFIDWYELSTFDPNSYTEKLDTVMREIATKKLTEIIPENDGYNLKRVIDYVIGHTEDKQHMTLHKEAGHT